MVIQEKNEVQIRNVLPEPWINIESECASSIMHINDMRRNEDYEDVLTDLMEQGADVIFLANRRIDPSKLSLVPEESRRIARKEALKRVPKNKAFIVIWIHDLVDNLHLHDVETPPLEERAISHTSLSADSHSTLMPSRQIGLAHISFHLEDEDEVKPAPTKVDSIQFYQTKINKTKFKDEISPIASTSQAKDKLVDPSVMNLPAEMPKKSILKSVGVQTVRGKKSVNISENNALHIKSDDDYETPRSANNKDVEKETQTKPKEKQD